MASLIEAIIKDGEMELNQFVDKQLQAILMQVQLWHKLDKQVKQNVPAALHEHFQVICVRDGQLIIHAYHPMAAARLKWLTPVLIMQLPSEYAIQEICIKQKPRIKQTKMLRKSYLTEHALTSFTTLAEQVSHHPELAQSIRQLLQNHKS